MAVETVDVDAMTPEDFAALVRRSSDSDLAATIAQAGEQRVLERVFETIPERLRASAAAAVEATMSFRILSSDRTSGVVHEHALTISRGTCRHTSGAPAEFRAGITCDVVTFSKLITGQANEITLFLRRKLKVAGDLAFAQGFLRYFDRPGA